MTTFPSRKTVRASIAALFDADAFFEVVFAYPADLDESKTQTPVCFVWSDGTRQQMFGANTNPSNYAFVVSVGVVAVNKDDAEDLIDDADQKVRQIIRNAIDNLSIGGIANINFDDNYSQSNFAILGGQLYRIEEWRLIVRVMPS